MGKKRLLLLLEELIVPIARLCLRHSLKLNDIVRVWKHALVRVAQAELIANKEKVSVSRISLMTGVHRQDVTRLREEPVPLAQEKDLISRVLGQWQYDPRFITKSGKPRVLEAEGKDSEFAALVHSVSAEPNPYSVLYEMERSGVVERTPRGVKLKSRIHVASGGDMEEVLRMLAPDVADLSEAVYENLSGEDSIRNLHLRTEFNRVAEESVPEIKNWLLRQGSKFHKKVRDFLAKHDTDLNKKLKSKKTVRVVYGSFSRVDDL
ncbi:MAG: hypothetical protein D6719_08635 [Candidatus Dadabacteria bacterium]|nr:MAG: hypothetical protein D6719_08635 [Candidatus Dadabacteria bacterium]